MCGGSTNIRTTENELMCLCLKDNILEIRYKPLLRIDFNVSHEIYDFRMRFQKGETYPVICYINNLIDCNKHGCDHMDFMGHDGISVISYVGDVPGPWSLVDYFLKTYKPTIPSFLTNSKNEALEFIKRHTKNHPK